MKRVLAAAMVAVCALGVAACQSNPQVAAYVNGEVITEDEVDAILDDARVTGIAADRAKEKESGQPLADADRAQVPARAEVVSALVLDRTCTAQQAAQGFEVTEITAEAVAASSGFAAASRFAQLEAHSQGCLFGAINAAPATVTPSMDQMRDIYDRAVQGGATDLLTDSTTGAVLPFEEWAPQFVSYNPSLGQILAQKSAIDSLVASGELVVNPRYRPIELVLATATSSRVPLVVSTIGQAGNNAVG